MKEAKESAAEHFEIEKHNLLARNQRLENEVKNLKSLLSSDEESSSSKPRMLSGLSDAVVGAIRRNTATSDSSPVDGEAVADNVKSLEKSMEKVSGGPRHVYIYYLEISSVSCGYRFDMLCDILLTISMEGVLSSSLGMVDYL